MTDADRFEAFVRRYQDMVYGTAVRLLGSPAEAEDAAQTVFLKAFQRFDEVVGSPAAAGWLKTTTRNVCLNHLSRYRARWSFFSELTRADDRDTGGYEATIAAEGSHALDLERADARDQLELEPHLLARHVEDVPRVRRPLRGERIDRQVAVRPGLARDARPQLGRDDVEGGRLVVALDRVVDEDVDRARDRGPLGRGQLRRGRRRRGQGQGHDCCGEKLHRHKVAPGLCGD